jgi:hypothetical protein
VDIARYWLEHHESFDIDRRGATNDAGILSE